MQQIFVQEPNLRISLENMKHHKFFADVDWQAAAKRQLSPVPYKPNPMKFKYLLNNPYEKVSSLQTPKKQPDVQQECAQTVSVFGLEEPEVKA